jgi:PHD/YefM family antitoxin component YafN of YafNO toxin-antitoxin module
MAIKILPSSEVRDHMAEIIKSIAAEGSSCFITQYGKASAVMISVDRFNELMSLVEDALDEKDELLALRVEEARRNFQKSGGIRVDL